MADTNISGSIGTSGNAILGAALVVMPSDANYTLTPAQYTNNFLRVTSGVSLTATRNIIVPSIMGLSFVVQNATSGGQNIQIIGSVGTGIAIPPGGMVSVTYDNTNFVEVGGSASTSNTFVIAPGGAAGGTTFTDFFSLTDAIQHITGKVTVYVDGSHSGNTVSFPTNPTGTLPMPTDIEFVGLALNGSPAAPGTLYPTLILKDNTTFSPAPTEITFTNLAVLSRSNTGASPLNITNSNLILNVAGDGYLASDLTFAFLPAVAATNSTLEINLYGKAAITTANTSSSFWSTVTADSTSTVVVNMYDASSVKAPFYGAPTNAQKPALVSTGSTPVFNIYDSGAVIDPFYYAASTVNYVEKDVVSVIFQEGGPTAGNAFGDWRQLVGYLHATNPLGRVVIYMSGLYVNGGGVTIPAGTYSMPYSLEFVGINTPTPNVPSVNNGYPIVTFAPGGVVFNPVPSDFTQTNCAIFAYNTVMTIVGQNAAYEYSNFSYTMRGILPDQFTLSLECQSTPFVALTSNSKATLEMYGFSKTGPSAHAAPINVDATSTLTINLYDAAQLSTPDFTVAPGGAININYASSGALIDPGYVGATGVTITYLAPNGAAPAYPGVLQPIMFQPGGTFDSTHLEVVTNFSGAGPNTLTGSGGPLSLILVDPVQPIVPVTVLMDFSQVGGTFTATANINVGGYIKGVYGWDYPLFHGGTGAITSATPHVFNTGSQFWQTAPLEISDLSIVVHGHRAFNAAPAYIKFSGNSLMSVISDDGNSLFDMVGNTSIIDMYGGVTLGDGTHAMITVDATSALTINLFDKSVVHTNAFTISGGGTVTFNICSSGASILGSLPSGASIVNKTSALYEGYTATTPGNWAGSAPITVQEALDRLAAHNPGA